jgi:hypothetical protein
LFDVLSTIVTLFGFPDKQRRKAFIHKVLRRTFQSPEERSQDRTTLPREQPSITSRTSFLGTPAGSPLGSALLEESEMRLIFCSTLIAVTLLALTVERFQSRTAAAKVADLKEQLEAGLKARLPADFAFIQRVVTMVENDQLPLELVKSTFQWARKKAKYRNYPFPYFERALRIRAGRLGIQI